MKQEKKYKKTIFKIYLGIVFLLEKIFEI